MVTSFCGPHGNFKIVTYSNDTKSCLGSDYIYTVVNRMSMVSLEVKEKLHEY